MNDFSEAVNVLAESSIPLAIGAGAAVARIGKHGWLGFAHFMREMSLCCFYGVVMYWILELADMPLAVKFGITGGGSYAFLELGDAIFERLKTIIMNFELADVLPWMRRRGNRGDE